MKKLLVCILFVLINTQVTAQDSNKGWFAYHAGDYTTALKELKPLAEQGNKNAQLMLGTMYKNGEGVLQDYAEAVKWYRLSAEQGDAYAPEKLGYMYYQGDGVLKDYAEAAKWYRLSAEQSNTTAQANLGTMYKNGEGVLQDNQTAHMWYNIASANGQKAAGEYRDKLAGIMSLTDISKATAMARECMKSDYKNCGN
jgi:uncharacterized protein